MENSRIRKEKSRECLGFPVLTLLAAKMRSENPKKSHNSNVLIFLNTCRIDTLRGVDLYVLHSTVSAITKGMRKKWLDSANSSQESQQLQ